MIDLLDKKSKSNGETEVHALDWEVMAPIRSYEELNKLYLDTLRSENGIDLRKNKNTLGFDHFKEDINKEERLDSQKINRLTSLWSLSMD